MSLTEMESYRDLILENIEYDHLCREFTTYREDLDEIVELMVETVCAKRKTTRIAGSDFPHEVVRSRFLKLDSEHIRFVMDSLQKNTTEVRNMKQYLLTVLFNAPTTISNHYTYITREKLWEIATSPEALMNLCSDLLAEREKNAALREENAMLEGKAAFYDLFIDLKHSTNLRTTAKELVVPERRFVRFLLEQRFVYRAPWNGDIQSKHAVVRYMEQHGREKDTAAWLAQEYSGSDSKSLFVIRAGSPEGIELPWPKVQRRIAQLINEDRFYTEAEQDRFDNIDPIAIREALAERGIVNGELVDEEIQDGETILLCGESGCGKTTLTRLINGLIPHYYSGKLTGQVLLDGKELKDYPLYQIGQRVGSVFQNPRTQFYNVDTTSEIVFGCENMALPVPEMRKRLEETAHSLKLEKLLNRSLFALSGGEKQKIACASADAIHPDIFVLDEPSSNLDISTIEDLIGVIRHWRSEKKTVIVAEHRLYYLVPYADRIIYMKHGSIVREFTGAEFQKLSPDELQGIGLRALDPFHLPPEASPKPSAPQLNIRGFQFSYEKHGPLNVDIPDLTLPQGEIIGIIGNNGAGKSTFARCLCGLDKKAKGMLEMDGASYDAKQRRHISYMVMQDVNHQLFTEDVLDELLLSMDGEDEKADTARAKEILNSLDLLDKVKLHPMSLSGGEKQRVAIGSAIASGKKILIFDEPTSGLDYRHMLEVSDNLNRLKELGKSLFLITHDPELIYKCCTYLLFIQGSKVLWHRPMDGEAVSLLRAFFSHAQEAGAVNASW